MLIGNDIIDLKDVDSYPPSENERFLNRVFRKEEQDIIFSSENPKKTLWTFWALKESAYKAWKRTSPKMIFSPISIKIEYDKHKVIHHSYGRLKFHIEEKEDDWVAVYVIKPRSDKEAKIYHWIGEVSKIAKDYSYNSSIAARILVSQNLGSVLQTNPENIEVAKGLPPVVINKEDGKVRPVSISHHGRYVSAFMMFSS